MLNNATLERLRQVLQSDSGISPESSERSAREGESSKATNGRDDSEGRKEVASNQNSSADATAAKRTQARSVIESIGVEFVANRKKGRGKAMAHLQESLMANAHVLIDAGMMSPKDWIQILLELDKSMAESGSDGRDLPTDKIAEWLAGKDEALQ